MGCSSSKDAVQPITVKNGVVVSFQNLFFSFEFPIQFSYTFRNLPAGNPDILKFKVQMKLPFTQMTLITSTPQSRLLQKVEILGLMEWY